MPNAGCDHGCDELFISLDRVMFWMIVGSTAMGVAGVCLYLAAYARGYFEDEELIKYQVFREEDPGED